MAAKPNESRIEFPEITAGIEEITPEIAYEMVETGFGIKNRNINHNVVAIYVRDMVNGQWLMTTEAIKFDKFGRLIDGQHRLYAVIESGVTIQSLVTRGLEPEAMRRADTGRRRTLAHYLTMQGHTDVNNLATATTRYMAFKQTGTFQRLKYRETPTIEQVVETLKEQPLIIEMVKRAMNKGFNSLAATRTTIAALWTLCAEVDEVDADDFFQALASGANLSEDEPVLVLRSKLIQMKNNSTMERPDQNLIAALMIKAWNAYREGRQISRIHVKLGGANREPYPVIK